VPAVAKPWDFRLARRERKSVNGSERIAVRVAVNLAELRGPSMQELAWYRGGKIICVGLNYRDHAEEQGTALPEAPLLFAKWQNTLIGPGEAIVIPPVVTKCDYEAELGVVIGERVRDASAENALEAVAGYVCVNDVSARDLQFADGQWTRGKSPDTFCPVGPALVSRDDIPDPQALPIRAILNGETVQESTTANMIFGVAEVIAYITRTITLEPGDLIATGVALGPAGADEVMLREGDVVEGTVEGIGTLRNPVRRAVEG
jgi:5-carboxymethyl-2-hydroxymuconate isomerase